MRRQIGFNFLYKINEDPPHHVPASIKQVSLSSINKLTYFLPQFTKSIFTPALFGLKCFERFMIKITKISKRIKAMATKITIRRIGGHKMCLRDLMGLDIQLNEVSGRLKNRSHD